MGAVSHEGSVKESIMAWQEQCDICLDMGNSDTMILHQGHAWCQSCILEYIDKLENICYFEGDDVISIREAIKNETRSPKRR